MRKGGIKMKYAMKYKPPDRKDLAQDKIAFIGQLGLGSKLTYKDKVMMLILSQKEDKP